MDFNKLQYMDDLCYLWEDYQKDFRKGYCDWFDFDALLTKEGIAPSNFWEYYKHWVYVGRVFIHATYGA